MAVDLKHWQFTVEQYHQMAEAGILREDDRVELIEGELIEMTPIGPGHVNCSVRLNVLLVNTYQDVAIVSPGNPVRLGTRSEPQPDFLLLKPPLSRYSDRAPTPEDVLLAIEVSDASASFDRHVKAPLYARYGIPELWLVDLRQQNITLYRDPTADGYRTLTILRRGDQIAPAAFPDRPLSVDAILG